MTRDYLGDRIKNNYENPYRFYLTRRTPVIIRIDMCHGHSFTSFMKKPYDPIFLDSMHYTAIALCEQIQNAELAYTQSDEISLLLVDNKKLTTAQWLDANLQKMCSISASIATIEFNRAYTHAILSHQLTQEETDKYTANINKMVFDSRVFNIPESEVTNYFIWRQVDATKNSIQATAQYYFSQNQIQGLDNKMLQDKLMQRGINWNEYPTFFKRGVCTVKETYTVHDDYKNEDIERQRWTIDENIPIFTQAREYIGGHLRTPDQK